MRLMPDKSLGVAVFCNRGGAPVPAILINHVLDRVCGKEPVPWLDRLRDLRRKALAQEEVDEQTRQTARKRNTSPGHELSDYAGSYEHPAYGRMIITRTGDSLHWAYRAFSAPLAHRHYETATLLVCLPNSSRWWRTSSSCVYRAATAWMSATEKLVSVVTGTDR